MGDPVLPVVNEDNAPFWDGAAAGELRFQRCRPCGHLRYPIAPICPACLSSDFAWEAVSGTGTVLSYVVFERAYHPSREGRVPYAVALIQTTEGPRMFADLAPGDEAVVAVGDAVTVRFDPTGEMVVPRFQLVVR